MMISTWICGLINGLSRVAWPWRACLQRCRIFLKPLVIMSTDLHQERKICRCNRELSQWLNIYKTCELCDMDLVGTKCDGWLKRECVPWTEIDSARSPGLAWESRFADGEDIVWPVQCPCFVRKADTGISNRHDTAAIEDSQEHGPQA